jgi:dolichol-phosphate mannosyltransferase
MAMRTTKRETKEAAVFGLPAKGETRPPLLSVVAPMYDEAGGVQRLIGEIVAALAGIEFEIVVVDDCSRDGTLAELEAAMRATPNLRVLTHQANAGQSRAVRTGVLAARGEIVATIDGDGQNDPADILPLYRRLVRPDASPVLMMVAGERRQRIDAASKRTASRAANRIRRMILDDGSADTGCGLKVFYRDAYLRLPYFDHSHRYLPALMKREGYEVEFRPVGHRAREHGASKYSNIQRLAVAFRDILGVVWLKARARSPKAISELEPGRDYDTI